jgi:hypothetical protein
MTNAYFVILVCGIISALFFFVVYLASKKGRAEAIIKTLEQEQEDMKVYAKKQSEIATVQQEIAAYIPSTVAESSARMRALARRNAERLRKPK